MRVKRSIEQPVRQWPVHQHTDVVFPAIGQYVALDLPAEQVIRRPSVSTGRVAANSRICAAE